MIIQLSDTAPDCAPLVTNGRLGALNLPPITSWGERETREETGARCRGNPESRIWDNRGDLMIMWIASLLIRPVST
jgi:hypothetical protein